MTETSDRLNEISDKMNEHMMAVKGTLELVDASVSEDDLHDLLFKAVERMESMQKLSDELFAVLKQIFEKMNEAKYRKESE
jgi:hypothetical protein